MNHHKQNYSNIGNSHTLNQHFESSGVAVLSFYYMYRILARPPILGICRPVCGNRHRDISFSPIPPFYPAVRFHSRLFPTAGDGAPAMPKAGDRPARFRSCLRYDLD